MVCAAMASVAASNTATSFIYFTIHDKSLVIYAGPAPPSPGIDLFCRVEAEETRHRDRKALNASRAKTATRNLGAVNGPHDNFVCGDSENRTFSDGIMSCYTSWSP